MLEQAGYVAASPADAAAEDADVVVINTCAVRENAADKLYGNLGPARRRQARAARACRSPSAAASRRRTARASSSGRRGSTSCSAPTTSTSCRCCSSGRATTRAAAGRDRRVAAGLPRRRCRPGASRSTPAGCRSASAATTPARSASCPHLRGKERDRRPGEILAEVEALVAAGRDRGHAARPERQLLRRRVRRPGRVRQAAARGGRDRRARAACGSPRRTRRRSPTTSSRRWPRRRP